MIWKPASNRGAFGQEETGQGKRIGFVAKRIAGTDGVSLEVRKWAEILEGMGHTCYYIAGQSDRSSARSQLIPEAHFRHPVIREIDRHCFGRQTRRPEVTAQIHEMTWIIKEKLHSAIQRFKLDLIIAENCLTIPMNVPLGLAVVETVMETGLGCIAHHHDFYWERERYLVNAVGDYLNTAFPPALPQIQHVVISTQAAREFSRRTGLPCRVIPNVMDFERPPQPPDPFSGDFRRSIGLAPDDHLILQPTRLVPRKGIEHSIELVRLLEDPRAKLVITHASGDEGDAYVRRIQKYAELLEVPVIFADSWISHQRVDGANGSKRYTIDDAYHQADLVTYPSTYEGFGNAFLEAVYFRKPILCNRYGIYRTDIEPCGFRVILMDQFLTEDVIAQARRVLSDTEYAREMAEHNYDVGRRFFSYRRVRDELQALLSGPGLGATNAAAEIDPTVDTPFPEHSEAGLMTR
jgi:glycosyltransferase involved in cell wall biosynthesis